MDQENMRVTAIEEAARIGAAREALRIAGEYIAAVNTRNLQAIGKTLHPDLHFVGPAGEVRGRENFLDTYHKVFANVGKLDITAESLANNLIFFKYYMVTPVSTDPLHGTMKTTHAEDGLIKKIEMASPAGMPETRSATQK